MLLIRYNYDEVVLDDVVEESLDKDNNRPHVLFTRSNTSDLVKDYV